jgi:hypothetical protein
MKDNFSKRSKHLQVPEVLQAIKERMVETRFNIDDYDIKTGGICARRNNLDKVVMGLYRRARISVTKEKDEVTVEMKWGGLISSASLSAVQFFLVAIAILRNLGLQGVLIALLISMAGIFINLTLFFALRARIVSRIKRDLNDLDRAHKQKRKKARMEGF